MKCFVNSTKIDTDNDLTLLHVRCKACLNDTRHLFLMASDHDNTLYINLEDEKDKSYNKIVWVPDQEPNAVAKKMYNLGGLKSEILEAMSDDYTPSFVVGRRYNTSKGAAVYHNKVAGKYVPSKPSEQRLSADDYNYFRAEYDMSAWLEDDRQNTGYTKDEQYWRLRDRGFEVENDLDDVNKEYRPMSIHFMPEPVYQAVNIACYDNYFARGNPFAIDYLDLKFGPDDKVDKEQFEIRDTSGDLVAEYTLEIIHQPDDMVIGYAYQEVRDGINNITMPIYGRGDNLEQIRQAIIKSARQFEHVEESPYL